MAILKKGLLTAFVYGVALFLQGFLVGTSPKIERCSDFPAQLLSMAKLVLLEDTVLALGLFYALKAVVEGTNWEARTYTAFFAAGCVVSFAWLTFTYYQNNGC
jgi:hypothetical protein